MSETSLSLLERVRGDVTDEAWQKLIEVYSALLRSWLTRFEVGSADADDLVQEVLLTLSRDLRNFGMTPFWAAHSTQSLKPQYFVSKDLVAFSAQREKKGPRV